MNASKKYRVTISVYEYNFEDEIFHDRLPGAFERLSDRVFKLSEEEKNFFCLPDVMESIDELNVTESTCFQVSKNRAFSLIVKRIQ